MSGALKHTPWAVGLHPWPEQIGCCPLVGRPYSIHGTDSRNVAAATTPEIARLIAASPDLLAALEDAVTLLEMAGYSTLQHRAAISKATGADQ